MASNLEGPRGNNGQLVRPTPPRSDSPSSACQPSIVCAPGGVSLGRAPPGFGPSPGRVPSRQIPPPPPPPAPIHHGNATFNAVTYPREWTLLHTQPKASGGAGPPDGPGGGTVSSAGDQSNPAGSPHPGGGAPGSHGSGGAQPPGGGPGGNPGGNSAPPGSTPPQQSGGAGTPGGNPPTTPPVLPPSSRSIDPWASLDRSGKPLPKLSLPSNYKSCSILDTQQLLEVWYDRSTFAIATWRGDAQRYWLTQVLDRARARRDQWLQSSPAQSATLEPVYILGDRKHFPDAQNAVESVLRTEFLEVIPKTIADACMRHGYCTAELIVWYVTKQLILPPDINEVAMQKEILTPPKISPATLDQACARLEEMQHRLNLCIKTKQNVHPRTIVAFVNHTLSGITQYYRTVGNIWDSLYAKHQLRESNQHQPWIGSSLCLQSSSLN